MVLRLAGGSLRPCTTLSLLHASLLAAYAAQRSELCAPLLLELLRQRVVCAPVAAKA